MDCKDIVSIIAILASPVMAVLITLFIESRRQKRRDKMELFKTLMTQRGFLTSYVWVNAINSVPIVFADEKKVIEALDNFMRVVQTQPFNNEEFENKKVKLLENISISLGYSKSIDWEQLRGAYIPQWLVDEFNFNARLKDAQLSFANSFTAWGQSVSLKPNEAKEGGNKLSMIEVIGLSSIRE